MYHSFPTRFLTRLLGVISIALTSNFTSATLPLDEARIANQRLYMLQFNEANDPSLNCLAIQIGNKTLVTPAHCLVSKSDATLYPLRHLRLTPLFSQDERYTYAHVVSVTTDHHKLAQVTTEQDWAILEVNTDLGCHQQLHSLLVMPKQGWQSEPVQLAVWDRARDALSVETCLLDSNENKQLTLSNCDEMSELIAGTPVISLIGATDTLVGLVTSSSKHNGSTYYHVTPIEAALSRLEPSQLCTASAF
ncbi:hypothetical protein ACQKP3_17125 [Vibrio sp. DNB22_10_4]